HKLFRRGSMRGRRIRQMCISTKKASIRVPKPMRWVTDLVSYTFLLTSIVNQCHILLKGGSKGFCHQTRCRSIDIMNGCLFEGASDERLACC
uniref:Uncharacterized protein n=1 Tax=Aegilops tauschii subsp. strangulata TaxID=200361 RepID=A0A453JM64_AEGTS